MIERREPPDDVALVRNEILSHSLGRIHGTPSSVPGGLAPLAATRADSLFVVAWRGRWILLTCVVLALAAGWVYIQNVTPVYTSTAKLWLDYTGLRIASPYEPGGRPQIDKYLFTQAERIRSRPILTAAMEALTPRSLRTFAEVDVPGAHLQRNISVDVGKKEEIISISFRSAYPVEAAEIVNKVVEAYMASRSEDEQRDSAKVLRILQDEMQRARKELDDKQNELTDFQANRMPLALGSDQGGGVMQRYLDLQNLHTQAQRDTIEADAFRKQVQMLADSPTALRQYLQTRANVRAYVGADQDKTPLESRLIDLELQRGSLLETFTADHPRIVDLTAGVERVEARLTELDDRFVKAVMAAAERQYAETKDYEEQLAQLCGQQQEQVVQLNAEVAQYQRLRSEVDRVTAYFEMLDEQVREIRKIVGEDVGQLRMAILEPALPPELPSEPQKGRVMAMALMLGLLLGGGIALGRDLRDQTLRSTDEISAVLRLPVLGVVPKMSRRRSLGERGRQVLLQPDSYLAEAFRTVRTAVFFKAQQSGAKTILITSPAAGDGKSTLVSNLAIAMARTGQKTLILDADFRKPTQHTIFELDDLKRSLGSVFMGRMKLGAAIRPTAVKGLHVLLCGQDIPNPAEVLQSRQFACLLQRLAGVYDRVLVDAPPVTVVTDAQIIGSLCDATVLVLRADASTRRMARRAVDALQSVGARMLGVVVNDVREMGDRYGSYYGRYRQYCGSGSRNGGRDKPRSPVVAGRNRNELPVRVVPERRR